MGDKLLAFYREAKERGGLEAQIKLAMITKLASPKAAAADDSTENIKLFEDAMAKIFSR